MRMVIAFWECRVQREFHDDNFGSVGFVGGTTSSSVIPHHHSPLYYGLFISSSISLSSFLS